MLELIKGAVGDAAVPLVFLVLFLAIGGGALWITPRLARWLDERDKKHKGYFDGMMTQPPEENEENTEEASE